jgi:hypothetical protein
MAAPMIFFGSITVDKLDWLAEVDIWKRAQRIEGAWRWRRQGGEEWQNVPGQGLREVLGGLRLPQR